MKKFFSIITLLMCFPFMAIHLLVYGMRFYVVEKRGLTEVELKLFVEGWWPHYVNVAWIFWLIMIGIIWPS